MMKLDLASTVAAMLGVTQAAAVAMGALTVWATSGGLIDIPALEQVGVGVGTILVALALGLGCARTLTGQSPRMLAWSFAASLVISAYWGVVRAPAQAFPVIPVVYAVFPMLGLALLAYSFAGNRRQGATAAEAMPTISTTELPAPSAAGQPDQVAEGHAVA